MMLITKVINNKINFKQGFQHIEMLILHFFYKLFTRHFQKCTKFLHKFYIQLINKKLFKFVKLHFSTNFLHANGKSRGDIYNSII